MSSQLSKSRKRRRAVNELVYTGNVLIDYINPIYKGNFNVMTGPANMGQKQTLNSIALNFLSENSENFVVYVTHSKKEAIKLSDTFSNKNFVILSLSETPTESEFYYLPRAAMKLISLLGKKNVLICYDDITHYLLNEKNIFSNAKVGIPSNNIFAEIRESCGNFSGNSLTSVIIADKNRNNFEFELEFEKHLNNILSFTDKNINFETNIKLLKSKIIFNF